MSENTMDREENHFPSSFSALLSFNSCFPLPTTKFACPTIESITPAIGCLHKWVKTRWIGRKTHIPAGSLFSALPCSCSCSCFPLSSPGSAPVTVPSWTSEWWTNETWREQWTHELRGHLWRWSHSCYGAGDGLELPFNLGWFGWGRHLCGRVCLTRRWSCLEKERGIYTVLACGIGSFALLIHLGIALHFIQTVTSEWRHLHQSCRLAHRTMGVYAYIYIRLYWYSSFWRMQSVFSGLLNCIWSDDTDGLEQSHASPTSSSCLSSLQTLPQGNITYRIHCSIHRQQSTLVQQEMVHLRGVSFSAHLTVQE